MSRTSPNAKSFSRRPFASQRRQPVYVKNEDRQACEKAQGRAPFSTGLRRLRHFHSND